ncbi:hypothetical protein T492DRAFT_926377 [Pavlovales sp. CCMP2436]|nr:hypothetical protein T492DRAFT_926377 [Pavlovales sp. CCMP2436]
MGRSPGPDLLSSACTTLLLLLLPGANGQAAGASSGARNFWENTASKAFSHTEYNRWLWDETWLKSFVCLFTPDSRVVDYGIGACLLGETLLSRYNISHYISIDLADRQLEACGKNLASKFPASRYTLLRADALPDLEPLKPTHFVSQAVIQHFPSRLYYESFAARINAASTLRAVMLQPQVGKLSEHDSYRATRKTRRATHKTRKQELALSTFTLVGRTQEKAMGYVFYALMRTPLSHPQCAFAINN